MSKFRVKWKIGDIVILEGSDIAEAFNNVGYTEADIEAIESYYEISPGDKNHPDYPYASFTCPHCHGLMNVKKFYNKFQTGMYQYICDDCKRSTNAAKTEERALVAMNLYCATGIVPTSFMISSAISRYNDKRILS